MNEDSKYEDLRKKLEEISEAIPFFFSKQKSERVQDRLSHSWLQAVFCLEKMIEQGIREKHIIGQIRPDIPKIFCIGNLRRGEFVLFENDGEGTVTVYQPYSKDAIERNIRRGSLNFSTAMINVPANYIAPLLYVAE